jgi:hypothetical protein
VRVCGDLLGMCWRFYLAAQQLTRNTSVFCFAAEDCSGHRCLRDFLPTYPGLPVLPVQQSVLKGCICCRHGWTFLPVWQFLPSGMQGPVAKQTFSQQAKFCEIG